MRKSILTVSGAFALGALAGALGVLYATDIDWLRSTLRGAVSWPSVAVIVTAMSAALTAVAAAVGLPMIYLQLKHTEDQTRAALGDESPYMDAVERMHRAGEFVIKIVNLNRRAMRIVSAGIDEGEGRSVVDVIAINGEKIHRKDGTAYRLPAMLPGWTNRSEEPPSMMIDLHREVEAAAADGTVAATIVTTYPRSVHCTVHARVVGRDETTQYRSRIVSEREMSTARSSQV